ncbi:MAG: hypothetical protein MGAcid_19000 [uncultured Acidilobus sp. MG]|jgi:hypothetical protein|nr:MAG: hypothetical protein MGAcid_19000 [uncultured Acidilobus sp. MG]
MKFDYTETRAVIRARPLDIKGPVNETYELLGSGDWDRLGREGIESSKGFHGTMWPGPSKGPWRG